LRSNLLVAKQEEREDEEQAKDIALLRPNVLQPPKLCPRIRGFPRRFETVGWRSFLFGLLQSQRQSEKHSFSS